MYYGLQPETKLFYLILIVTAIATATACRM